MEKFAIIVLVGRMRASKNVKTKDEKKSWKKAKNVENFLKLFTYFQWLCFRQKRTQFHTEKHWESEKCLWALKENNFEDFMVNLVPSEEKLYHIWCEQKQFMNFLIPKTSATLAKWNIASTFPSSSGLFKVPFLKLLPLLFFFSQRATSSRMEVCELLSHGIRSRLCS